MVDREETVHVSRIPVNSWASRELISFQFYIPDKNSSSILQYSTRNSKLWIDNRQAINSSTPPFLQPPDKGHG